MAHIRKTSARRSTPHVAEGRLMHGWSAAPIDIKPGAPWKQQFTLHFKLDDEAYNPHVVNMSAEEAYKLAIFIARRLSDESPKGSFKGPDKRTDAECLLALAENAKQGVTYL